MFKKQTRVATLVIAFLVSVLFVVMACGPAAQPTAIPTKSAPSPTNVQPTATAVATPTKVPPSPTAAPTVKRGGTLAVPQSQDISTKDPSKVSNSTVFYTVGIDWSQLVRFGNQKWSDISVVGDLAKSWEVSTDGKTYTFRLDPNARWQNLAPVNGRGLTAQDVKWFLDLLRSPEYKSAHAPILADISSIDVVDATTVRFNLKGPFAGFVNALANPRIKILSKEVYDQDGGYEKTIVGSGAWQFSQAERGVRIVNVRNPNYWKLGVDGKALPYIDTIEVYIVPDAAARLAGIQSGRFAFESPAGLDPDPAKQFMKDNPNIPMQQDYRLTAQQLFMNMTKEPFKSNLKLRQAIMKAIDQSLIASNAYHTPDAALESPITSGMKPYTHSQDELKQRLAFDLPGAKKLLDEAGSQPGPLSLQIYAQQPLAIYPSIQATATILRQQLQDLGINTTIGQPTSAAEGLNTIFAYKYDLGLASVGYEGDIYSWFRTYYLSTGASNKNGLNDPKINEMIAQFGGTLDQAKSVQIAQDIQRYILDNAFQVPTIAGWMYIPYQPWLKDFSRSWPWGFGGLEKAWIDK